MIKIWFFWTPNLAKRVLEDIVNSKQFEISFVVTWTDKPVWRSQTLTPTPVKEFAVSHSLKVLQPAKIRWNEDFLSEIKNAWADYFVVVAYGKILPNEVLKAPRKMCINVHGSILPLYRWASPIQSALIDWETLTWITIMKMSEWMDEWDIIDIMKINIDKLDTSESLFKKFEEVSGKFLIETLVALDQWKRWLQPQLDEAATYCKKITKEDGLLDFSRTAQNLFYLWRWLTPWPWIYAYFEGKKLIITSCDFMEDNVDGDIWQVVKWDFWIWIKCWIWMLILKGVKLEWKWNAKISDFVNWKKNFIWYVFKPNEQK
ncbi:MAG: Methionyl-tRNA formyltransferase [uncultured bacterium (gcode 4)]|uniref:methionyl-tRNA formyltransferase n=1 Tax=uncultured bacterium (gcode 4) TaxID=1234023 RepID=K2FCB8_9BACT|nr:MAG: Methionyl-tRNA formyltransferase [uncultured bacterium (gcode 4)]